MAHRTGLEPKNCYWHQSWQQLLLSKEETASTFGILEYVGTLHETFLYSNWVYAFAGVVLEKWVGESFGSFVQTQIFEPLDLHCTTIGSPPLDNVGKSYQFLNDGTAWEIPNPQIQDNTIMGAAEGAKSCVNDLLKYYVAFLAAAKHQIEQNCSCTPVSPFRRVGDMVKSHIEASSLGPHPQSYGLGWVVTELPSVLGLVGLNGRELGEDMPVVGRNVKSRTRVLYHNGNLPGAFSSVYLLPDSDTVIVVLSNSLGTTDAPYWIGQLLMESILEETDPHDFVDITRRTRDIHLTHYPQLKRKNGRRTASENPQTLTSSVCWSL